MVERTYSTNHAENKNLPRSRNSQPQTQNNSSITADEIILSLANTYENKRARQVFEWERSQATNARRAT
jgi:hypothetical protein